jgi:hypothetical protein
MLRTSALESSVAALGVVRDIPPKINPLHVPAMQSLGRRLSESERVQNAAGIERGLNEFQRYKDDIIRSRR